LAGSTLNMRRSVRRVAQPRGASDTDTLLDEQGRSGHPHVRPCFIFTTRISTTLSTPLSKSIRSLARAHRRAISRLNGDPR
jgi:hypothetical protein